MEEKRNQLRLSLIFGDTLTKNRAEKNQWKKLMLEAIFKEDGIMFPDDWDTLTEDEKEKRLDLAIKETEKW